MKIMPLNNNRMNSQRTQQTNSNTSSGVSPETIQSNQLPFNNYGLVGLNRNPVAFKGLNEEHIKIANEIIKEEMPKLNEVITRFTGYFKEYNAQVKASKINVVDLGKPDGHSLIAVKGSDISTPISHYLNRSKTFITFEEQLRDSYRQGINDVSFDIDGGHVMGAYMNRPLIYNERREVELKNVYGINYFECRGIRDGCLEQSGLIYGGKGLYCYHFEKHHGHDIYTINADLSGKILNATRTPDGRAEQLI